MIIYAIAATIAVSLVSLVSVITLSLSESTTKKLSFLLVSVSAGTLIGDVFIHLLPEASKTSNETFWLWVIGGIGIFFVLEKIIHWRHCHVPTSKDHPHPVGTMNLVGDGFHNFLDGALIAGSFIVSVPLGITTTIAVLLHELPQEIGDFGVLIHAGYTKARAIFWNFIVYPWEYFNWNIYRQNAGLIKNYFISTIIPLGFAVSPLLREN